MLVAELIAIASEDRWHKRLLDHLAAANKDANPELMRLALKLATGAGKTTMMAMLITWQTINAVRRPASKHFTPGPMRRVSRRNASCRRGRPRPEGGRVRRDGSQTTEPVRAARHGDTTCANPTIRLHGITTSIASALRTEGGHLSIGRGGFTLYYARGARLSGYDCEQVKACCIAAGMPVIDSRTVPFEDIVRLAVRGSMAAVGEEASPPPYHALSYAPLAAVASAYRAAGAEVFNIPGSAALAAAEE